MISESGHRSMRRWGKGVTLTEEEASKLKSLL